MTVYPAEDARQNVPLTPCHDTAGNEGSNKRRKQARRFDAEDMKKPRAEMLAALRQATAQGPLFVGVFANQPPAEVLPSR